MSTTVACIDPDPGMMPKHAPEDYIGLMSMAEMMREQAVAWEKDDPLQHEMNIVRTMLEMIDIHPSYAQDMACFYENVGGYPDEEIERCYATAMAADDMPGVIMNAADFYKKRGQRDQMITHLLQILRQGQSYRSLASLLLALHYAKMNHEETAKMYYDMAVDVGDLSDVDVHMDSHELIKLLDFVQDKGWRQDTPVFAALQNASAKRTFVRIYRTKKALFTKLNHWAECGVCFNHALHLDIECGHCVCEECYLKLMNAPCPFCRYN